MKSCIIHEFVLVILTFAVLGWASNSLGASTIYVDDNATNDPGPGDPSVSDPLEDGSSAHPFDAIQEGIDAASTSDTVLVKNGTYDGTGNKDLDLGGKAITVQSENGSATCTIDCEADENNEYRAFYFHSSETTSSVVDGFTITNGYIVGNGGGIYCDSSSPAIENCVFIGNSALDPGETLAFGGGIYCTSSSPVITDCTFEWNVASGNTYGYGGGAHFHGGSPTITDCVFSQNGAPAGGGMSCGINSSPTITGCTFYMNDSTDGAGFCCYSNSVVTMDDCLFTENIANDNAFMESIGAGGGLACDSCEIELTECTFSQNEVYGSASSHGGAMFCDGSDVELIECTFSENAASAVIYGGYGGGIWADGDSFVMTDCVVEDNQAESIGGGLDLRSNNAIITGCTFSGNATTSPGGAIYSGNDSTIVGCTFTENSASEGGGVYVDLETYATLTDCTFQGNKAAENYYGYGGGVSITFDAGASLTNCSFSGNASSLWGGAVFCDEYSVFEIMDCTFAGNVSDGYGGGVYCYGCDLDMANSVLWSNLPDQVYDDYSTIAITYSDVEGGWTGTGNIDADPRFVLEPDDGGDGWGDDPSTPGTDEGANDDYGDLRLRPYEPNWSWTACIDTGSNAAVPGGISTDILGNPRIIDGDQDSTDTVDMGAYELTIPGDTDSDCDVDLADLSYLLASYNKSQGEAGFLPAADLNCDGVVDLGDLSALLGFYGTTIP